MLRLFRQVRSGALNENRFVKYLFYAVGEVVLVVIGILIALQVNNQNDFRKERVLEKTLLKNLLKDLESDNFMLDVVIADNINHLAVMDTILQQAGSGSAYNYMDFLRHNGMFPLYGKFISSQSTYIENLSSGKLSLMQTDSLKTEVLAYYEIYLNYLGADRMIVPLMEDLTREFNDMFSGSQEYALVLGLKTKLPNLDIGEVASNPKYQKIITQKYGIMKVQIESWNEYKSRNEYLRMLIQKELDSRFN
jgi:hypothetical protein